VTEYWSDNCFKNFALKNHDEADCTRIRSIRQRQDCFKELALLTNTVLFCEPLEEVEEARCIVSIAKNTKDEQVCSALKTPVRQQACISKVAKAKGDKTLCEQIESSVIKNACLEYFTVE
jgi:hypothetical protein